MLWDEKCNKITVRILYDPLATMLEISGYVQRVMNSTPPDDKENMAAILFVGIANAVLKQGHP